MKNKKTKLKTYSICAIATVVAVGAMATPFLLPATSAAATLGELREKTNRLEKQIKQANQRAENLNRRGDSLQTVIASLDAKIAKATTQIQLTQTKIAKLEKELEVKEKELDRQKELLKASMRALYKRSDASTVELLVGSDSFSEFIDEQVYLERLKLGIQDSATRVIELKQQIEAQKTEQENLKEQQEAQRALVLKAKHEQAVLLAETRGQESAYRARSASLQKQQAKLLSEIVARSRVLSGVGTGSYPWASYKGKKWTHEGSCYYGNDIDPWGYCYRQCTSFAAWRLYSAGKKPPKSYGNAENWDNAAKADGYKTSSKPKVGAIAVWNGVEGHVAYVEEVFGNGEVRISEYNAVPPLGGKYSQRIISANDPAAYIYF
jgi:peptidoglycan DL-endopeptidase CwlO